MRGNITFFLALLVIAIAVLGAIVGERALAQSGIYNSSLEARFNEFVSGPTNATTISTAEEEIPVCFVVCIFGKSVASVDKVQPIKQTKLGNMSSYNFFAYTNLPDWNVQGWTRVVKVFPQYRRFITQSRWPKFQAWKDPAIKEKCKVVFYMDSISNIKGTPEQFQETAREILQSNVGLAQYKHRGGGGAMKEFWRVARVRKDLPENIAASKAWLLNQTDFRANCTLYENRYFSYAVESPRFQEASDFLWNHYSLEKDSWRDQPLWCYVLDHFHMTPVPLNHEMLFGISLKRMTRIHKYSSKSDEDASIWANKTQSP